MSLNFARETLCVAPMCLCAGGIKEWQNRKNMITTEEVKRSDRLDMAELLL